MSILVRTEIAHRRHASLQRAHRAFARQEHLYRRRVVVNCFSIGIAPESRPCRSSYACGTSIRPGNPVYFDSRPLPRRLGSPMPRSSHCECGHPQRSQWRSSKFALGIPELPEAYGPDSLGARLFLRVNPTHTRRAEETAARRILISFMAHSPFISPDIRCGNVCLLIQLSMECNREVLRLLLAAGYLRGWRFL